MPEMTKQEIDEAITETFGELPKTTTLAIQDAAGLTAVRGETHGRFSDHSKYTQQLKTIAYGAYFERRQRNQPPLTNQQKESLEMILHKVGRILAGDAGFQDHWDDIGGYAHIANKEFK